MPDRKTIHEVMSLLSVIAILAMLTWVFGCTPRSQAAPATPPTTVEPTPDPEPEPDPDPEEEDEEEYELVLDYSESLWVNGTECPDKDDVSQGTRGRKTKCVKLRLKKIPVPAE